MDVTLEQVEKLVNLTGISFEEAKKALDAADGDIREAIIAMERAGNTEKRTGAYGTNGESRAETNSGADYRGHESGGEQNNSGAGFGQNGSGESDRGYGGSGACGNDTSSFGEAMNKLWRFIRRILHRGNINHFEVYRRGESVISVPVTVLVIALVFLFWVTLPVLIIALFFGCKYRFRGPDLGRDSINNAMNAAADTAEDIKRSVSQPDPNRDDPNRPGSRE
jgi:hypothetical protein